MKRGFLLLTLIAALNTVYAQRPDREKVGTYTYVQLPLMPLPKEYKTYSLTALAAGNDPYVRDQISGNLKFNGFDKSNNANTDFKVTFEEYPFGVTKSEVLSKVITNKVDGVETKTTLYFYDFSIRYQAKLTIGKPTGEEIFSKTYDLSNSYKTDSYASSSAAFDAMNDRIRVLKSSLLSDGIRSANNDIESNFTFPVRKIDVSLFKVKQKKFDYPEFEDAFNIAKDAAETSIFKNENDVATASEKFKPAFEKWESALKEADLENKKARIDKDIVVVTYYNEAVLYFLLKDYDKTLQMISKCFELKKNQDEAEDLKRLVLNVQNRASKNI